MGGLISEKGDEILGRCLCLKSAIFGGSLAKLRYLEPLIWEGGTDFANIKYRKGMAACTGEIGNDQIFVYEALDLLGIRPGERGEAAI